MRDCLLRRSGPAWRTLTVVCALAAVLAGGCAGQKPPAEPPQLTGAWGIHTQPGRQAPPAAAPAEEAARPGEREPTVRRLATGPEAEPLPGVKLRRGALAPPTEPPPEAGRTISFKDAPLSEVIPAFAELLGINVVTPSDLKGTVTLHSGGPLRAAEVLPLFVTVLELNGYALVHGGGAFQVVPLNEAKYAPMLPPEQLGKAGAMAAQGFGLEVFYLTYLPADQAVKTLRRFVSKAGDLASVDQANAVVVAEGGANLQKIRRVLALLDVPFSRRVTVRVYQVKNVAVKSLAKDLKSIFGAMGVSEKPQTGVWADIVPLPELDSIAVISSVREMFDRVEQWLADLDRQIAESEVGVFVYQCQSGDAATIAEVLTQLFAEKTEEGGRRQEGPRFRRSEERAGSAPVRQVRPAASGGVLRRPGEDGVAAEVPAAQAPEPQTPMGAELQEGVRIVVEPNTNALVIRAPRPQYEELLRTIHKLDVFPRQVLIEVMIAEVALDNGLELGVEWKYTMPWDGGTTSAELKFDEALNLTPNSGLVYTITQADRLTAALRALAQEGRVNVVSAPLLLSAENQESRINVGEEVPIVTDVTTSQNLTTDEGTKITDRSIKYRDTGIILSVTPRINDSGLVKMQVVQEVTDIRDEAFGKTESPSFFKRSATTNVITTDGQSIVIAGLIEERTEDREAGIPWLSQIPLLGYIFKSSKQTKSRTELVITLTPHVIHDMADARQILEDLQDELKRLRQPFVGQAPVRSLWGQAKQRAGEPAPNQPAPGKDE
jgi:general secretion pathway protein D